MAIGIALILRGVLGWLPLLGFWMVPDGAARSVVRHLRRRTLAQADDEALARLAKGALPRWPAQYEKKGPEFPPAPKALGNGGVSSREDDGMLGS